MAERALASALPPPDRASDAMIARCRREVEGRGKAMVRRLLLPWLRRRLRLAELGEGFQWGRDLVIGAGSRIGRFAYLGPGFASHGPVVVGDLCMIAAGCRIVGDDHLIDRPGTPTRLGWPDELRRPTIFGADVWVGERVTIREGVTIGAGAVVGSAATVVRDVAPYTIVAGTPARVVRDRFEAEQLALHDAAVRGLVGKVAA
jgi:acetyltransferase-like isoleucine patch superfamily enzyme